MTRVLKPMASYHTKNTGAITWRTKRLSHVWITQRITKNGSLNNPVLPSCFKQVNNQCFSTQEHTWNSPQRLIIRFSRHKNFNSLPQSLSPIYPALKIIEWSHLFSQVLNQQRSDFLEAIYHNPIGSRPYTLVPAHRMSKASRLLNQQQSRILHTVPIGPFKSSTEGENS